MEKIQELLSKSKGGVYINFNMHRDSGESIKDYIKENAPTVLPELLDEMIAKDTIVHITYSPDSVLEWNEIYHYDLKKAVEEALGLLKMSEHKEEEPKPETCQLSLF